MFDQRLHPVPTAANLNALHAHHAEPAEWAQRARADGIQAAIDRGHTRSRLMRHSDDELPSDRSFIAMLAAYRASGGIACLDTLAHLPVGQNGVIGPGALELTRSGAAFSFEWRDVCWVPLFQFGAQDQVLLPGPRLVAAELGGIFDGFALASWFAQANCWLHDARPVDLLYTQLALVLAAARVDRFIANG